mgnify:CR=1 FL=1
MRFHYKGIWYNGRIQALHQAGLVSIIVMVNQNGKWIKLVVLNTTLEGVNLGPNEFIAKTYPPEIKQLLDQFIEMGCLELTNRKAFGGSMGNLPVMKLSKAA